jgi:hypothetical protein
MTMKCFVKAASITAVVLFMMVASASANIIYRTDSAGTIFVGGTDTLNSTGGAAATLIFTPNPSGSSGVPSNVDYGDFLLACTSCGIEGSGLGTAFGAFNFDLIVIDTTDNVQGEFVGHSTGGLVYSDVSQVSITWTPAQLGPGTSNVLTGLGTTFNNTFFTSPSTTLIVAPNSGSPKGDTTVQGTVNSSAIPEPATLLLLGAGLLGLGVLRRKRA